MKRLLSLAVALCLVIVLVLPVNAESLDMYELGNGDKIPYGYLYPHLPKIQKNPAFNEVWFYDFYNGMYYNIAFKGSCSVNLTSDYYGQLYFNSDISPSDISVRAYRCDGRDIFSYIDGQNIKITIPDIKMRSVFSDDAYASFKGALKGEVDPVRQWNIAYNSRGQISGIHAYGRNGDMFLNTSAISQTISLPDLNTTISRLNLNLSINDFAIENVDYFRVKYKFDDIDTSLDFNSPFSISPTGLFLFDSHIPYGALVSSVGYIPSSTGLYYKNTNAYYSVMSQLGVVTLNNSEALNHMKPLDLNIFNRLANHFGLPFLDYDEQGNILENDLSGLGNEIGDIQESIKDFPSIADSAISKITNDMVGAGSLAKIVWDSFPSWVWSLITVGCVWLIGRKVVGR